MKCERAAEFFTDYLEGTIDYALASAIRGHMEQCPSCRREFHAFREMWASLSILPQVDPPAQFRHSVIMRAAALQHERKNAFSLSSIGRNFVLGRLAPSKAVALALAAMLLAVVVFVGRGTPTLPDADRGQIAGPPDAAGVEIRTQAEEKYDWQDRKLARNLIWVKVDSREAGHTTTFYRVVLSFNSRALLPEEHVYATHTKVFLLKPGEFSKESVEEKAPIWAGLIGGDSPVLIPVIMAHGAAPQGCINLMVTWRFRRKACSAIVMLPSQGPIPGDSRTMRNVLNSSSDGSSNLYPALQAVAYDYGIPVIADSGMREQPDASDPGETSLCARLDKILGSTPLDWTCQDDAVHVDRRYPEGATF